MTRQLTRRDFINGVAIGAAGLQLSPLEAVAEGLLEPAALGADYYPPALTGMRGSVTGTYEVAHALAREGKAFAMPAEQTESTYDLVVVGGGISGWPPPSFSAIVTAPIAKSSFWIITMTLAGMPAQ